MTTQNDFSSKFFKLLKKHIFDSFGRSGIPLFNCTVLQINVMETYAFVDGRIPLLGGN